MFTINNLSDVDGYQHSGFPSIGSIVTYSMILPHYVTYCRTSHKDVDVVIT